MSNPIQTGDGVGFVTKVFSGFKDAFSNPDKDKDEKKSRSEHFSDGANYDKILRTARLMAKDKYRHRETMFDKAAGAIKPGTKGEAQSGKTSAKGTFVSSTSSSAKKPAAKKPAASTNKKAMTTKQAAVSAPVAKKPTGKSALKTEPTKTPPPTSTKARKVK